MAKMSWINRNERKRATVKKYAALRAELKAKKDYAGLCQLPRDASPSRVAISPSVATALPAAGSIEAEIEAPAAKPMRAKRADDGLDALARLNR